jgi:hypothetical protein
MVGVDGEAVDARPGAGIHGPSGERPMEQGHQRLRQMIGEGAQAGAESRAEYEGLIHRAAVTLGGPEFKPSAVKNVP